MLKNKSNYSEKIINLFKKSNLSLPEIDFDNLSNQEILQYAYLAGAIKIKNSIQQNKDILKIPNKFLNMSCDLTKNESEYRNQNIVLAGRPGSGKTHLAVKLFKNYFCEQFIPEEIRESPDFFNGEFAQGVNSVKFRKMVFVSESHCLDMFSRNISGVSAFEHFGTKECFGAWDLENLSSADFLVINDIGSRKAHSSYAETLFGILDSRMEDLSKVTVFTTNADEDQLTKIYGAHFTDRLKTFFNIFLESDSKRKLTKVNRAKQELDFYTGE